MGETLTFPEVSGMGDIAGSDQQSVSLRELSPRDRPWDDHRRIARVVESYYRNSPDTKYSDRMEFCSTLLDFGLHPSEDSTLKLKLRSSRFCRVRFCPVCQWRRSLQWQSRIHEALPEITMEYPKHRWLFLTLTARHEPITSLRKTVQHYGRSYQRLSQLKNFPAIGWLRSLEVTRSDNNYAHAHFHCLLMVPPSYYGANYIKHDEWVALWRKCLRVDYDPNVDVRSIAAHQSPIKIIPELVKYCTKESDLIKSEEWFLELSRQLHKTRAVATGGILKNFLKELEEEPEDLIGESDDNDNTEDFGLIRFEWKDRRKQYELSN